MMNPFSAAGSIQKKLTRIMVLTTGLTLFVACLAFVVYDAVNIHRNLPRRIGTVADILSLETVAALDFRDKNAMAETLTSLKADKNLIAAAVYDTDGNVFATYTQSRDTDTSALPPHYKAANDEHYSEHDFLFVVRPVEHQGRQLGTIILQADTSEVIERLRQSVIIIIMLFLMSVLLSTVIAARFQKAITQPILQLSKKTEAVSKHKDFSIRAEKVTDDELGILVDSFNDMLAQIQNRDESLHRLNEELEDRVKERTNDLSREIGERKLAEEEVRTLNLELEARVQTRTEQLESANKELESFAYTVSHDLRAPLRHVTAFAELLGEEIPESMKDSREYLRYITESIQKMDELINDLLSFSKMGRQGMTFTSVDMKTLVKEVIGELDNQTKGRKIDWKISDLPVVSGDPTMLRSVWANLIGNAVKYSRPRDVAVIEVEYYPDDNDSGIKFHVRDNGVGFNMKYVHKLFGVFQRLHGEEEFEGTGIGLATVRRIINRHYGEVWAESELNKGTTIFFTIPKNQGETDG